MPARCCVPVGFERDPSTRITKKTYSSYHRYSRLFALHQVVGRLASGQPAMLLTAYITPEYLRPENPDGLLEAIRQAFAEGPYVVRVDFWTETRTFGLYLEAPTVNQAKRALAIVRRQLIRLLFDYRKSIQDLVDANPAPASLTAVPRRLDITPKQWKRYRWRRNLKLRSEAAKAVGESPVKEMEEIPD